MPVPATVQARVLVAQEPPRSSLLSWEAGASSGAAQPQHPFSRQDKVPPRQAGSVPTSALLAAAPDGYQPSAPHNIATKPRWRDDGPAKPSGGSRWAGDSDASPPVADSRWGPLEARPAASRWDQDSSGGDGKEREWAALPGMPAAGEPERWKASG
ncbi:hypothetical protein QJQ45_016932, partial [Haematococcus lacustris]